jgi:UDP-N-acetylglucosamine 2-epimerase
VITDSGGLQKTSAFFGKKTLIMRENTEWKEAEQQGFARLATLCQEDADWLMSGRVERDKLFYLNKESGCMPSEIIFSKLKDLT